MAPGIGVLLLVLLAALMHAAWNAIVKRAEDPLVMQALIITVSALIALPFALMLPAPGAPTWAYIAAGVLIHGAYFALLVKAYQLGEFSHVYPIARGTGPLLVALAAGTMIGEQLSLLQIGGVALVSVGLMSLAMTAPGHGDRRAPAHALAVGVSIAAYTIVDGLGVRSGPEPFPFIAWLLTLACLPIAAVALWRRGFRPAAVAVRRQLGLGLFAGSICGLAYAIVLWAYSQGALATIAALRETSVIFAALIGTLLFGEPFGRRRIAAAGLVAAGAVLLNLSLW